MDPAFTQADFERIAAFLGSDSVLAGFSTHAHYDHLFWSPLFGDETPRYCSEGTLDYVTLHHQEILDELIALEDEPINLNHRYFSDHLSYLSSLSSDLHYLYGSSVVVVDIPGHLYGQSGFLFPEFRTLFAADTLSNIEPPSIEGSWQSLIAYLESLATLKELISQVEWIVPGHGDPMDSSEAKSRLDQDRRYLEALRDLRIDDFGNGLEAQAKIFLLQTGETRVANKDAWLIHLGNLQAAYNWLSTS